VRGWSIGLLLSLWLCTSAQAQLPLPPPVPPAVPPSKCTLPVHDQFDFWLGEWEVYMTAKPEQMIGASSVDKAYNNCAVRESWKPFTMLVGASFNTWDKHKQVWRQTWVDADNSLVDFEGGIKDGKMVLTGLWRGLFGEGKDALMRMSYAPLPERSVRQIVETSVDQGKTWQPAFDYTYKRRRGN
jgi:hypothetical protein